jgi:hypothetical protein
MMTCELNTTLVASGIDWPALRNHIRCIAHLIQLALGALMSFFRVNGGTMSWKVYERDDQFEANGSPAIGKS